MLFKGYSYPFTITNTVKSVLNGCVSRVCKQSIGFMKKSLQSEDCKTDSNCCSNSVRFIKSPLYQVKKASQ